MYLRIHAFLMSAIKYKKRHKQAFGFSGNLSLPKHTLSKQPFTGFINQKTEDVSDRNVFRFLENGRRFSGHEILPAYERQTLSKNLPQTSQLMQSIAGKRLYCLRISLSLN